MNFKFTSNWILETSASFASAPSPGAPQVSLRAPEDDPEAKNSKPQLHIELSNGQPFLLVSLRLASNSKTIEVSLDGQYSSTIKALQQQDPQTGTQTEDFVAEDSFGKKVVKKLSLKFYSIPAAEKYFVKVFALSVLSEEANEAATKGGFSFPGGSLDFDAVKNALPENTVLSAGALELMTQMKQQQKLAEASGGDLMGSVGSTMAIAGVMQMLASGGKKPEAKPKPVPQASLPPAEPVPQVDLRAPAAVDLSKGDPLKGIERALLAINEKLADMEASTSARFDKLDQRMQRLEVALQLANAQSSLDLD